MKKSTKRAAFLLSLLFCFLCLPGIQALADTKGIHWKRVYNIENTETFLDRDYAVPQLEGDTLVFGYTGDFDRDGSEETYLVTGTLTLGTTYSQYTNLSVWYQKGEQVHLVEEIDFGDIKGIANYYGRQFLVINRNYGEGRTWSRLFGVLNGEAYTPSITGYYNDLTVLDNKLIGIQSLYVDSVREIPLAIQPDTMAFYETTLEEYPTENPFGESSKGATAKVEKKRDIWTEKHVAPVIVEYDTMLSEGRDYVFRIKLKENSDAEKIKIRYEKGVLSPYSSTSDSETIDLTPEGIHLTYRKPPWYDIRQWFGGQKATDPIRLSVSKEEEKVFSIIEFTPEGKKQSALNH